MPGTKGDVWFPAKKHGVGWGLPVVWQGWAVLLAYLGLVFAGVLAIQSRPVMIIPFVIYVLLLSAALIFICWKKGEKIK